MVRRLQNKYLYLLPPEFDGLSAKSTDGGVAMSLEFPEWSNLVVLSLVKQ